MKRDWVKILVRLEHHDYQIILGGAHAARLPISIFARELLLNRRPSVAPPVVSELCFEAQELLNLCKASISNLTQLEGHCNRLGNPFTRLLESIETLRNATRKIGLDIKAGVLTNATASDLLNNISHPSTALNDLARNLNSDISTSGQDWFQVLTALKTVLLPETVEAKAGVQS